MRNWRLANWRLASCTCSQDDYISNISFKLAFARCPLNQTMTMTIFVLFATSAWTLVIAANFGCLPYLLNRFFLLLFGSLTS